MGALFSDLSVLMKLLSVLALPLLILSSCYMLKFLHMAFYSEQKKEFEKCNDITVHEFVVLASVVVGLIIFGVYPNSILNLVGVM
jgi:NADH:ubiquinone oxidoreductase subunit 4 (subunit M)